MQCETTSSRLQGSVVVVVIVIIVLIVARIVLDVIDIDIVIIVVAGTRSDFFVASHASSGHSVLRCH